MLGVVIKKLELRTNDKMYKTKSEGGREGHEKNVCPRQQNPKHVTGLRVPDAALSFEINEFRVWRSALILFRTSISRAFQ